MPAKRNFTPIVVKVLVYHAQTLWLRLGTVRYGFPISLFFNELRAGFVPVRFCRRRYGTYTPL
jgi:hypothetical protein